MNFLKPVMICSIVSLLTCNSTFPQERRQYGREWRQLNLSERTIYLSGLQEGAYQLNNFKMSMDNFKELNLNQTQKDKITILIKKHLKEIDISSLGTGVVAGVMEDLYKDPANTFIPWNEMAELAIMRLQGKPGGLIMKTIEALREAVDRMYEKKRRTP